METRDIGADCLVCGELIIQLDCMLNEIIYCELCGGEFEVISFEPLKIEEVEDDGEDWGE